MSKKRFWKLYKKCTAFVRRHKFLYAVAECIQIGWIQLLKCSWLYIRSGIIRNYLSSHAMRKLQLGAHANLLPEWLNSDIYPRSPKTIFLDATKKFPFKDHTFHYVSCEHLIEHLSHTQGLFMLKECFRVLKPGGKIRLGTPNLQSYLDLYTPQKSDLQQRFIQWFGNRFLPQEEISSEVSVINHIFRGWGHQFIYDQATLTQSLQKAGFTHIKSYPPGESEDVNLQGIETHGLVIENEEFNAFEILILEAVRPESP